MPVTETRGKRKAKERETIRLKEKGEDEWYMKSKGQRITLHMFSLYRK